LNIVIVIHPLLILLLTFYLCCFAACPAGLVYAEEGFTCINFQFAILTKELSAEIVTTYSEEMTTKINAGELYDVIKANHPETYIYGLGNPGAGTFYDSNTDATAAPGEPAVTTATPGEPVLTTTAAPDAVVEEPAPEKTGLGAVAIVFIVLAVVIVPIAIVAGYKKYRETKEEETIEGVRQYDAIQTPRVVEAGYDETASSLAAMGAAGTAAAMLGEGSE
jgi:hypothetical protein